jgi:heme-degrading monooxygenase HmoA
MSCHSDDAHFAVHISPRISYLRGSFYFEGGGMIHVIVRHKVADYPRWKEAFDAHLNTRRAGGELGHRLFVSVEDPRDVTIVLDWDTLERAQRFAGSDELKQAMQKAGVVGEPEFQFLHDAVTIRRSSAD